MQDGRELAAVIWLGVILTWAVSKRDIRGSLGHVVVAAIHPKVAIPLLVMSTYVAALIYVGANVGLWNGNLMSDTVTWAVGTGLALYGKSLQVFQRGGSFKQLVFAALGLTVFVEGFANLYVFPLVDELVLLPVVLFLVAMSAVAGADAKYGVVKKLTDGFVAVIGLALILYVGIRLATGWQDIDRALGLQKLALPAWLTLGVLPFIAAMGLWSNYDTAISRIRCATEDRRRRMRARLALLTGLHVRARELGAFNGPWCKELTAKASLRDARAVVRRFRRRDPAVPFLS